MRKIILVAALAGFAASLAVATDAQAKKHHARSSAPATHEAPSAPQSHPGGGSNSK